MTVTTPDRSVVLNTSGLPAEEGSARRHAPAEADPQGRHRASAPMEGGTGHHAGSPVAPASEAGFQSYSMFSGSRPANAVPVYRSATGHGAGARPGATGAGGPSTPRREPARAPRRTPSPGRVVRPAAVKGPGSQRPSAAPDRATTSSTPQARPVAPRSGPSGASSTGSPAPDPRPATPPRPAAARPATPPPAGTAPAASPTAPGGARVSATEAELSALLLGGAPTHPIDTGPSTRTGSRRGTGASDASSASARSGDSIVARPGDPKAGTPDGSRASAPAAPASRPAPAAAPGGRARSAAPSARSSGMAPTGASATSAASAASTTGGFPTQSPAPASGAARRRPVFAPGTPSASSAGTTGPVGILPSPASAGASESSATLYRVVVADQQVAVTAAHETSGAARPASPARASAAPARASAQSAPAASASAAHAVPAASAAPAAPAAPRPASARSAPAGSVPTKPVSRPATPPRAASGTASDARGREVWSTEGGLTWVALSGGPQTHPGTRRHTTADGGAKRRGIPTALKVLAVVVAVLLVVLAAAIWGLPMLLGPDFSLSRILGSLLGQSSAVGTASTAGLPGSLA